MAEGVPRERRATTCRGDGSERRPSDPSVDLQKEITALAGVISRMVVQVATLTKQIDDERNIRANQQQIGRGSEQRRVIVNVHSDTRSGGDTADTPILEVVVTPVENWDIFEESVRDLRENNPVSM